MRLITIAEILQGDSREVLKTFPDNHFHAILTDPPYELNFMNKNWDNKGIAYNIDMWAECLRVLKPGGHMLAFGGTRTYHRMACAIEDAGFEIRDCISWNFGSGFPKSLSIDKAIDKYFKTDREVIGRNPNGREQNSAIAFNGKGNGYLTAPAHPLAKKWAGYGSALKPAWEAVILAQKPLELFAAENASEKDATCCQGGDGKVEHEFICLARKPLSEKTIAANVLRWGCGGLNVDGCRIPAEPELAKNWNRSQSNTNKDSVFHGGFKAIDLNDRAPSGRFPANLIWSHSPNCKRIGTKKVKGDKRSGKIERWEGRDDVYDAGWHKPGVASPAYGDADGLEEVESWDCDPSCPSWQFAKAGERKTGICPRDAASIYQDPKIRRDESKASNGGDTGSASRFFQSCPFTEEDIPTFLYYAKASRAEREKGLDGMPTYHNTDLTGGDRNKENNLAGKNRNGPIKCSNNHPCVKPLSLMRTLCRLITPPGGLILDPFTGSGTTLCAASLEGFDAVGIELNQEYVDIARARLAAYQAPAHKPLTAF